MLSSGLCDQLRVTSMIALIQGEDNGNSNEHTAFAWRGSCFYAWHEADEFWSGT